MSGHWGSQVEGKPKEKGKTNSRERQRHDFGSQYEGIRDLERMANENYMDKHRESLAGLQEVQREMERENRRREEQEEQRRRDAEEQRRRDEEQRRREAEEQRRREAEEQRRREEEQRRREEERQREEERRREAERERRMEEERERRREEERERRMEEERERRREEERERRMEEERERRREEEREQRREQARDSSRDDDRDRQRQEEKERERQEEEERRRWEKERTSRDDEREREKQRDDEHREAERERERERQYEERKHEEVVDEKEREYQKWKEERDREKGYDNPFHRAALSAVQDPSNGPHSWKDWNRPYDDLHYEGRELRYEPEKPKPKKPLVEEQAKIPERWRPASEKPKTKDPEKKEKKSFLQKLFGSKNKENEPVPATEESQSSTIQKMLDRFKETFPEEKTPSNAQESIQAVAHVEEENPIEEPDPEESESYEWPPDFEYQTIDTPVGFPKQESEDSVEEPVPEESESYEWPPDYVYETIDSPVGFPKQENEDEDEVKDCPLDPVVDERSQTKKPWGNQHEDWSVEAPVSFENSSEEDGSEKKKQWGNQLDDWSIEPPAPIENASDEEDVNTETKPWGNRECDWDAEPPAAEESSSEEEEFEDAYKKEGWTNDLYEDTSDDDFIGAQPEKLRTELEEDLPYVDPGEKALTQKDLASGRFSANSKFLTPSGSTVSLDKKLGEGAFGKVFEGTVKNEESGDINEGKKIAIKIIEYKSEFDKSVVDPEIDITKKMSDAGFGAQYFGDEKIPNHKMIYMEKLGGSLDDLKKTKPNYRFSLEEVNKVGKQLCQSLSHLNSLGLIHSDLKMDNICSVHGSVDDVKIIDYGCVKEIEKPKLIPEYPKIDERHDSYDVGATMVNMYTGVSCYDRVPPKTPDQEFPEGTRQFVKNIVNCSEGEVPQKLIDSTLKLMDFDQDKRPTPKEALEMNLFD